MPPPSEESPLLGKQPKIEEPQDVGGSTDVRPVGEQSVVNGTIPGNGTFPNPADLGGGDLERQTSVDERRARQYEGNKDVAKKLKYILPAVGVGLWLAAADQTLVVSSYGKIGNDLTELNKSSWIATAYFLTLTSFQPLYGKLSDIFGRKPVLLVAYLLFGIGCLWCGTARSMDELIAARAFAGIGGGGMTTVVSILMSDIIPLKDRGLWQGIINIIYAAGSACGAPLGGILADTIGWRWAFTAQAPMCFLAFIACYFILELPTTENQHWKQKLRRVDFAGAFTLVCAIALILVGLDRGSNVRWNDKVVIATLSGSVLFFLIFIFVEARVSSEPLAPGRVIFPRAMLSGYLCNLFAFGGWFGTLFYLPLYYQSVSSDSASQVGLRLLPGILATVFGSLTGGYIIRRTGRYFWLNLGAYGTMTLGALLMFCFTGGITHSTVGTIVALVIEALGSGEAVTTSLIAIISNADPDDQAVATACSYLFRSLGSALGLSIVSSFFQQQLRTQLNDRLSADGSEVEEIVRKVRESLNYINELSPARAMVVRDTYSDSLKFSFALVAGIVACAFISSFFIREKRLSK